MSESVAVPTFEVWTRDGAEPQFHARYMERAPAEAAVRDLAEIAGRSAELRERIQVATVFRTPDR